MSTRLKTILSAVCLLGAAPFASADVLTFDDLSGSDFFTSNYRGFQFGTNNTADNAWFYSSEKLYDTDGNVFYQSKSGSYYVATDYRLYDENNYSQATQAIKNNTAFTFQGAYFSGDGQIQYQLYGSTGNLLYTSVPSASLNGTPTFVASGYAGLINSVVVVGHQGFYALDDFTFNTVTMAPIPEPSTYALMALGLGAIGFTARRRRSASVK